MSNSNSPATWFKVVAIIALIWNVLGVVAYFMEVTMTEEAMAAMDEATRNMYQSRPTWAISAFAVAVWAGFLGAILLVIRRGVAQPVLIISLLGILAQNYYSFFVIDYFSIVGYGKAVMPVMVILIGIFLVWMSRHGAEKGWMK